MAGKKAEELRSARWFAQDDLRSFGHRSRMMQMGYALDDFMKKPVIGIINTWSDLAQCHTHFPERVEDIKRGIWQAGGVPFEFPTTSAGEPLVRPDVVEIVAGIAAMEGPQGRPEVSMTTNGLGLAKIAPALKEAGLARVNVSLDTLHPERFHEITRRDRFDDVVAGMAAAHEAGLRPVKVNSVLQRGINDDEVVDLTRWAVERGYELRFIEQMPLDAQHSWERTEMITGHEILASLRAELDLEELPGRGAAPAERFLIDGGPATVGVVASVTMPFCGSCDRLRLTADGQLRNCLFANGETDLRGPLRSGATEEEIHALVHECLALKLPGHGINEPGFLQPPRPMSAIGG